MRIRKGKEDNLYWIGMQILSEGLEIRKETPMTIAKQQLQGHEDVSKYLSLTDADIVSMQGLSASELGEVPPLREELDAATRGENFGDARKWLGRTLGWFQFAAVSLRAALDSAETEDALRERLTAPEEGTTSPGGIDPGRLRRILHATAMTLRHIAGPFAYLADGDGQALRQHADAILEIIAGPAYANLESEEKQLTAMLDAAGFACAGARARLMDIAGDEMEHNAIEGLGHWNGSWHKEPEVAAAWAAWTTGIRLKEDTAAALHRVQAAMADIATGINAEIYKAMQERGGIASVREVAEALDISQAHVEEFGADFMRKGGLLKERYD